MTRCWMAKTFQDCAANAKQEGGGVEGSSITTNISDPKARKSIERFFIYIYIYIYMYI